MAMQIKMWIVPLCRILIKTLQNCQITPQMQLRLTIEVSVRAFLLFVLLGALPAVKGILPVLFNKKTYGPCFLMSIYDFIWQTLVELGGELETLLVWDDWWTFYIGYWYLIKQQHLVITVEIVITGCILGVRKAFWFALSSNPLQVVQYLYDPIWILDWTTYSRRLQILCFIKVFASRI